MKNLVYKVLGFSLLVAAVIGILVSLAGLIVIIRVQKQATVSLTGMLELLDSTLTTTENGFEVADNAFADAIDALESLQMTVDSVEVVMGKTLPTLDSISELIGTKLPSTIRSTRGALNVAQTAAKNVDNFLTTLSSIPIIGTVIYNPETPLNQTISKVSDSLKDTPEMLKSSQENIDQMSVSLGDIQTEMKGISGNVRSITSSVEEARAVLQDYQESVKSIHNEVNRIQEKLPTWMRLLTAGFTLIFIWLALAQVAIAMQGLELLARGKPAPEKPPEQ
jgi:methyl-accepting chemotaxis protein